MMATLLDRQKAYQIAQAVEYAKRKKGEGDILSDIARANAGRLVPIPRTHPFRDPARFTYSGELVKIAKANGVPASDQLAHNIAPGTLSRLANLQAAYGRPMDISAAFSSTGHKKKGAHPLGMAFDLNVSPPTEAERARVVELATQMGFTGTGTYQSPLDTKNGFDDPRVHVDIMGPRTWGYDGLHQQRLRGIKKPFSVA